MQNPKFTSNYLHNASKIEDCVKNQAYKIENLCNLYKKTNEQKNIYSADKKLPINKALRFYLGDAFPGLYLTLQEARCAVCFLEGLNNRETAYLLKLSIGTVNFYGGNMRLKLHCENRREMLAKIKNSEFQNYYQEIKQSIFVMHVVAAS